ncbi:MAG TPA: protein-methionine-sulfoxide reductase heme-binding subunit MsrQ [Longimicrobiales bacterium]|nr:protein-methionine-sulfoxide reductase heme-binding subunit MsrQ [Longimicrobiales bacterium]
MPRHKAKAPRLLKPALWVACLIPAARLAWRTWSNDLGPNPIEEVTHETGEATLILLLVTLAVTPLRRLSGWNRLIQLRRPLGLFAFFYATLHFSTYIVLDQFFAFEYILDDIRERPYITVGTAAFLLLIPLAVTSTKGWIRRLGRRWSMLHRLIYVSAALGVLHYIWLVKADLRRPLVFAAILALLLLLRTPPARAALGRARDAGRAAWRRRIEGRLEARVEPAAEPAAERSVPR